MSKNIEIKYLKEDGTYETLYPKIPGIYTKEETLVDGVKALYGFDSTATPNDIFAKLALPANYYGFKILVLSPTGEPVPNCLLPNVFVDMHGNTGVKTGADGIVYCGSATQSVTFNFGGDYFAIVNKEYTFTANSLIPFTPITIALENDTKFESLALIENSVSYKIMDNIIEADLCAVGGGGGGGGTSFGNSSYGWQAGGGGGGYVSNLLNQSMSNHKSISFSIGAGGNTGAPAGSGGTTKISIDDSVILSANGGQGGQLKNGQGGVGGTGNGNGGFNSAGSNGTVRVFNDPSLPLPGGGGGHGRQDYLGGADFGGHGGGYYNNTNNSAGNPTGPGGGGGGGGGNSGNNFTKGHSGGVYVRVRFKS